MAEKALQSWSENESLETLMLISSNIDKEDKGI